MRNELVAKLNEFYDSFGIVPNESFACSRFLDCLECAKKNNRLMQFKGAQAHLGHEYGNSIKVVVLSLDQGGGATYIEKRTNEVYSYHSNSHMKGTIEFLSVLFENEDPMFLLRQYAMTNSAKCSGGYIDKNSMDKMPSGLYSNCSKFHVEEVKILNPDLIFAEGVDSALFIQKFKIENNYLDEFIEQYEISKSKLIELTIRQIINKYIYTVFAEKILYISAPHPSARFGQWQQFRDISLPIIKLFIDFWFYKFDINKNLNTKTT